ncbi:MAG: response regulator transcription factor [Candidatus Obscuribacterales bacterium]|jgi:OmpR-family two-component system manganese-sensing response regulator|nr:response regulator transcription factor [Candidatus Obscuribacterales bacterium]
MPRVLAIDDDVNLLDNVKISLEMEKIDVDTASTAEDALWLIKQPVYDLLILDWQIPGTSGIELCQAHRRHGYSTPVMMLTAMDRISDKEVGFNAGADDYLTKPFDIRELILRVRALLKRSTAKVVANLVRLANLEVNLDTRIVSRNSEPIHLKPLEYKVLEYFIRHPSILIEPQVLLDNVWGAENEATVDSVYSTVARLRKKLELTGPDSPIQTSYGRGYRFLPQEEKS